MPDSVQSSRRPYYWPADGLHLLNRADGSFHLRLSNKSFLACLQSLRASAQGYEKYLSQYPSVLCAPLDLLYLIRRAACTLDEALLQDLLFSYSWREANWGAWLAALAPNRGYVEHLRRRRPTLPYGAIVVDLASAACGGDQVSTEYAEHWMLLCELRELLGQLPRVVSPLRIGPTIEEEAQMKSEMEVVRAAYRQGGATAARKAMGQKHLSHYLRGHLEWAGSFGRHGA